jgi:hypothetical protein
VVPYLENSTVLQFALPERQDEWLRSVVLSAMRSLKQRKLIAEIPRKFQRDAPKIKLLLLSVAVLASRKTIRRRLFFVLVPRRISDVGNKNRFTKTGSGQRSSKLTTTGTFGRGSR